MKSAKDIIKYKGYDIYITYSEATGIYTCKSENTSVPQFKSEHGKKEIALDRIRKLIDKTKYIQKNIGKYFILNHSNAIYENEGIDRLGRIQANGYLLDIKNKIAFLDDSEVAEILAFDEKIRKKKSELAELEDRSANAVMELRKKHFK